MAESMHRKRLIKALDNYGWRLGTGFLSTPLILDVLSDINVQYAYRLLENEEMPGWLFMPKHGGYDCMGVMGRNRSTERDCITESLFQGSGVRMVGNIQLKYHRTRQHVSCFPGMESFEVKAGTYVWTVEIADKSDGKNTEEGDIHEL